MNPNGVKETQLVQEEDNARECDNNDNKEDQYEDDYHIQTEQK